MESNGIPAWLAGRIESVREAAASAASKRIELLDGEAVLLLAAGLCSGVLPDWVTGALFPGVKPARAFSSLESAGLVRRRELASHDFTFLSSRKFLERLQWPLALHDASRRTPQSLMAWPEIAEIACANLAKARWLLLSPEKFEAVVAASSDEALPIPVRAGTEEVYFGERWPLGITPAGRWHLIAGGPASVFRKFLERYRPLLVESGLDLTVHWCALEARQGVLSEFREIESAWRERMADASLGCAPARPGTERFEHVRDAGTGAVELNPQYASFLPRIKELQHLIVEASAEALDHQGGVPALQQQWIQIAAAVGPSQWELLLAESARSEAAMASPDAPQGPSIARIVQERPPGALIFRAAMREQEPDD